MKNIKRRAFFDFFKKKSKEIILPYLFWSLLIALIVNVAYIIPGVSSILIEMDFVQYSPLQIVVNTLTFSDYYIQLHWFLYVLYFVMLLSFITKNAMTKPAAFIIIILLCITTRALVPFPYIVSKFVKHLPNFMVGRMLTKCDSKQYKQNTKGLLFAISLLLIIVFNSVENLINPGIELMLYSEFIEFLTGILGFALIYVIATSFRNEHIKSLLTCVGNHSMSIYLMHQPYILYGVSIIVSLIIAGSSTLFIPITFVLSLVAAISVPILVDKFLLRRLPRVSQIIIGRRIEG